MEFTEPINLGIKLYQELAALNTPDEIADVLRAHNIKAERADSNSCAITNYLIERSGVPYVSTGLGGITFADINLDARPIILGLDYSKVFNIQDHTHAIGHSEVLAAFVAKFDHGDYPDLVDPDSDTMACKICDDGVIPYNSAVGLHKDDNGFTVTEYH